MKHLSLTLLNYLLIGWGVFSFVHAAYGADKKLIVLPSTDTSELGIHEFVQELLVQRFVALGTFDVDKASKSLLGFQQKHIDEGYKSEDADVLSFVFMETSRISIFLFDKSRKREYLVVSETLEGSPMSKQWLNTQFNKAFAKLIIKYRNTEFLPLPTEEHADTAESKEEEQRLSRDKKTRELFEELSKVTETPFELGMSLGMARFAGGNDAASTLNIGGVLGYQWDPVIVEGGIEAFNYLLLHGGFKYEMSLSEKYLRIGVGANAAYVFTRITRTRGFDSTLIKAGGIFFGPAANLDIPLMGATLRAELKYLFGGATIFLGSYGIVYNL